jgi:hypothetical protein
LELSAAQQRLAPRASGLLHRRLAARLILLAPPAHRLIAHLQLPADLGIIQILGKQRHRRHPALLQGVEVAPRPSRVSHAGLNPQDNKKFRSIT